MIRVPIVIPRQKMVSSHSYGYIYITTNVANKKQYVGQHSGSVVDKTYLGSGVIIFKAIQKYGKDNFISEPIDWANSKEELDQKEIWWIDFLGCVQNPSWYNLATGGEGYVPSVEQRKQLSIRNSGEGNPRYGVTISQETKTKISQALRGKMSKENNPFYGHKHDDITKQKMRGRKLSEEQRQHLSSVLTGKPSSFLGKHHTEESKERMRGARPCIVGDKNPNYHHYWSPEKRHEASVRVSGVNNPRTKEIVRLSLDYQLLEEYPMIKCAIQQGYNSNGIQGCLQKRTKCGFYKGFRWMYKSEYDLLQAKGVIKSES